MDAMLQKRYAKYIYIIPDGLRELMTDISREVLRSQPENMYTFIADYLDALMITRENARVAARLVQNITEITTTTVEFLKNTGMSRSDANNVVSIIQTTLKNCLQVETALPQVEEDVDEANIITQIISEAKITEEQGEEAARIIQHAFRTFKLRKEKEKELLSGMVDWRVAARSAIYLYRKTGVTNEEANRAATLIKAAYKGYYTRRIMRKITDEGKMLQDVGEDQDDNDEDLEPSKSSLSQSSEVGVSKVVSINYDTVTPHVDFDYEVHTKEGSSTSAVVANALDNILQNTFKLIEDTAGAKLATESNALQVLVEVDGSQTHDLIPEDSEELDSTDKNLKGDSK